jgi:hypothetical protein
MDPSKLRHLYGVVHTAILTIEVLESTQQQVHADYKPLIQHCIDTVCSLANEHIRSLVDARH